MTERTCHEQLAHGRSLDDEHFRSTLVAIWERAVYGAG
jgi:hypothetical protein